MRVIENGVIEFLSRFDEKPFKVISSEGERVIGEGEPLFTVKFNKTPSLSDLTASSSVALGESYTNGDLEIEGDLYSALSCFIGQIDKFSIDKKLLKKILFSSSSKKNRIKDVSSHYDIGNDFYALWLDETLSYSCGYFANGNEDLKKAQEAKIDRILKKLYLKEGTSLCDIGCGWGFLLMRAAEEYGVYGLGITLSERQKTKFEQKIRQRGLEKYITVKLMDYSDLPKIGRRFDRAVSVGMLEHVGRENYGAFMETVKKILKPQGVFLLHFISALKENPGDAWIKKYIFPGGTIPSLREIISTAADNDFYTVDAESLRRHYTKTLLCWNKNFQAKRSEVVKMFDEKFAKMWELYLCACAAAFDNGVVDLHQLLFTNGASDELPLERWY